MSKVMIDELKQISSRMRAISKRSEQNGRTMTREEQEALDQLSVERDELMGDMIFRAYG